MRVIIFYIVLILIAVVLYILGFTGLFIFYIILVIFLTIIRLLAKSMIHSIEKEAEDRPSKK